MRTLITFLVLIFLGIVIGGMVTLYLSDLGFSEPEYVTEEDSELLLEKIQKVYKLVVVEGEFVELITHNDYYGWDLPGFRKKAIVKVKAKVSVGYDLDNLQVDFNPLTKTVYISQLPDPEILAIDTDISYYDLNEGMFNSFSPKDLTQLNKRAKETIRKQVARSNMMLKAREQSSEMLEIITMFARESGWKVRFDKPEPTVPRQNDLETPTPVLERSTQ